MRAIAKATAAEKRVKISKKKGNIFGTYIVQIKLSNTGHIADKSPLVQSDQFRMGRRMYALARGLANKSCTQLQSGLQPIEQTRLSNARSPHKKGNFPAQKIVKRLFTRIGNNTGINHGISHCPVRTHNPICPGLIGEIELVETQ